jgi:hypothetical protein
MERLLLEQTRAGVDTVKTRPSSTAILAVNSADRYPSGIAPQIVSQVTSPYNFTINTAQPFISGFFTRVALTEVLFPYFIPNINEFSTKMYINYSANGNAPFTQLLITFDTTGFYEFADIATELQVQLRAATGNNSFTCNYAGYVFDVNVAGSAKFWFTPYYRPAFPDQRGLYEMMNWTTALTGQAGASNQAQSGIPTLLFTKYVDIVCDNLTTVQDVRDSSTSQRSKNVLCRLYFDATSATPLDPTKEFGASPFTIYRDFNTPKYIKWEQNLPIGSLSFQVYNDCGYQLSPTLNTTAPLGLGDVPQVYLYPAELPDYQMTLLVSEQ